MTTHLVANDERARETTSEVAFASVCSRVVAHAAVRPDHPAVVDGAGGVSFAELVGRSGELAARLVAAGVGPGSCVGVFLDRSVEFVVAALAVMRAGAAYLPVDVGTPAERVGFVLADAGAVAVVTAAGEARLPAGSWSVVDVADRGAGTVSDAVVGPEDLAYVIYTSGSTGRPKGVELTQANLVNLVDWHVGAFGVTAADRAAQVASVGFDAAVWEIWPALAAGATLLVPGEGVRRSAPLLRDWVVAEGVHVAFAPTVLAEQLVDLAWPAETRLRTLLTGADVLHRRPPVGLPFGVVNNYGPTECTVVATSGPVSAVPEGSVADGALPSIGRPIGDTVALVLDEALAAVPAGEAGELCLGGSLVGRGYRGDPELTAARFVTVHRDGDVPVRVYRTGDRVRRLPGGELAFLGRLDRQVKLRGYRIEPDEVVAALGRVPSVASAAVVVRTGAGEEPELVAYVVGVEGAVLTAAELRVQLGSWLPEYMVPATFVGVAALPVTLHGKLDEAGLPAPSPSTVLPERVGQVPAPAVGPEGSVEERVAEMVRGLLKLSSVAAGDNIFLVGGHSMLAMQVVSRVQQVFGVKLALRQVFESPTIAGIAATITARTATTATAGVSR